MRKYISNYRQILQGFCTITPPAGQLDKTHLLFRARAGGSDIFAIEVVGRGEQERCQQCRQRRQEREEREGEDG